MSNWKTIKLSDMARIYDGTHQTPHYVNSGVPFYSVEHVTSGDFSKTKFISEEVFANESRRVTLEKGDILMTRIGDVGNAKYIDWNVRASFYVSLALLKCTGDVDPEFVTYMINSDTGRREIWAKTLHVAFPNKINLGDIGECTFSIPDRPTQVKIVKVIKSWDEYLEKLDKKIELKKNIKKGLMQQLLTGKKRLSESSTSWDEVKLGSVADISKGKALSSQSLVDGDIPVIAGGKSSPYKHNQHTHQDVITVSASGAYAGYVAHHPYRIWASDCTVVRGDGVKTDTEFVYYFLKLNQEKIYSLQSGGAQPHIYPKDLSIIKINLPLFDEQKKIASILNVASSEIEKLENKRRCTLEQKKFLINSLISGKIRTPENLTMPAKEVQYA